MTARKTAAKKTTKKAPAKKATKKAPAKKATAKKATAKKATAKKATKKATTRKAASKKATKKAPAKKAPAKKAAPKKAAAPAKKAAPKKEAKKAAPKKEAKKAAPAAKKKAATGAKKKASKRSPYAPNEPASAEPKPGLGYKWICYACGAKFYDLGKEDAICPKCEADQRLRPKEAVATPPKPTPAPKRPAAQPMARYLDDEETVEDSGDDGDDEAKELDIESLEGSGDFGSPADDD